MDYSDFSEDERKHQRNGRSQELGAHERRMKIVITVLSLILIILLLPLATNHCLPLLSPVKDSILERLWSVLKFIAMTTAISVGIISTSQRSSTSDTSSSSSDHHRVNHREYGYGRSYPGRESPRRIMNESNMEHSAASSTWKGKEIELDEPPPPRKITTNPHILRAIYGNEISSRHGFSRFQNEGEEDEVFIAPKRPISSSRSENEVWFFAEARARLARQQEQEMWFNASTHQESEIQEVNATNNAASSSDIAITGDASVYYSRRPTSRQLDAVRQNGRPRRRSSSLERPIKRSSSLERPTKRSSHLLHGQDPGLKALASPESIDQSKAIVKLSEHRSIQVYNPPDAVTRIRHLQTVKVNPPSPLSGNRATHQNHFESVLHKSNSSTYIVEEVDDEDASMSPVHIRHHPQFMMSSNSDLDQISVASNQVAVHEQDVSSKFESNHNHDNVEILQEDTNDYKKVSREHIRLDAYRNASIDYAEKRSLHKVNKKAILRTSSISNLISSSKHSRSDVALDQLAGTSDNSAAKPPRPASSSLSRRTTSQSCDFGDDFNPEWLLEEPQPPPGLISESETEDLSKSFGTKQRLVVQSLLPWRQPSSNPINIAQRPISKPRPSVSEASGDENSTAATPHSITNISPSPGELNRRANEFISKFNNRLFLQKQESMERRGKRLDTDNNRNHYHY